MCFARTLSVKRSCAAAGFDGRTSFARASRLLERDDVHALVRSELLRESAASAPCGLPEATDAAAVPLFPVRETFSGTDCPLPIEDAPSGLFSARPADQADGAAVSECVDAGDAPRVKCDAPNTSATAHTPDNAEACGTNRGELPYDVIEERILREYERIAFADTESGEVKTADKLRALEQYRAIAAARHSRDDGMLSLTVNYDYGDSCE